MAQKSKNHRKASKKYNPLVTKIHDLLTKNKFVVIGIVILGLVGSLISLKGCFDKKNEPNISITLNQEMNNKEQILENNYGNLTINFYQTVTEVPNCTDCPLGQYHPLVLYQHMLISCQECGFEKAEIDLLNVKFNLPNNNTLFLNRLPYDEPTIVGFCNSNETLCDILPQYLLDKEEAFCLNVNISKYGGWNIDYIQEAYNEKRKCITFHDTNIKLSNVTEVGLINHFKAPLQKDGKETLVYSNYYKVKMLLPNGQTVYFDKFMYNESIIFAICNNDKSECYIIPKYRFTDSNDVCLEVNLSEDWGYSGWTVLDSEKRNSCVQEAETGKFFDEYPVCI